MSFEDDAHVDGYQGLVSGRFPLRPEEAEKVDLGADVMIVMLARVKRSEIEDKNSDGGTTLLAHTFKPNDVYLVTGMMRERVLEIIDVPTVDTDAAIQKLRESLPATATGDSPMASPTGDSPMAIVDVKASEPKEKAGRRPRDSKVITTVAVWLERILETEGPQPVKELEARAERELQVKPMTLRRARGKLGVKSKREGFGDGGRWVWELSEREPTTSEPIDPEMPSPIGEPDPEPPVNPTPLAPEPEIGPGNAVLSGPLVPKDPILAKFLAGE